MTRFVRIATLALAGLVTALFAGAQDDGLQMLRDLREQSRQSPDRLDLRLAVGNAAVQTKEYDLALQTFQDVLAALPPDSPEAGDVYLRIGETARRKGDLEKAADSLRRAGELLPANPTIPGTLALVLEASGKFAEAQNAYRAALKLDPENAIALNNLAYLLSSHSGNLDEALSLAIRANETAAAADSADFADTLAMVHAKMGHLPEAEAILVGIVSREPKTEEFRGHLAQVLAQKAGRSDIEEDLLGAIRAEPTSANIQWIGELAARVAK
jgi:Flp pilus assembly protein TadD